MKIVKIKPSYCNYLRTYDYRVPFNMNEKSSRPFIGIIMTVNDVNYFAPLSSPKPKHLRMRDSIDFIKIENGKLGVININNMIPVPSSEIIVLPLNSPCITSVEQKYQTLLKEQARWIRKNSTTIKESSIYVYNLQKNKSIPSKVNERFCNFKLLEEKCKIFEKMNNPIKNKSIATKIINQYREPSDYDIIEQNENIYVIDYESYEGTKEDAKELIEESLYENITGIYCYDNYREAIIDWVNDVCTDMDTFKLIGDNGEHNFYLSKEELSYIGLEKEYENAIQEEMAVNDILYHIEDDLEKN